jgi:hypothetical protein
MSVKDWSSTAADNTTILSGITLDGATMTPSQVDNAFREMAAQIASQMGLVGAEGADIASAATVNLASATGWALDITGTTTITGFGTVDAGQTFLLRFPGILTLTHNATSLILPGSANITTAANDVMMIKSEGSGNWRCMAYQRADGSALVGVTPTGTQTLTNKTLTSPTINGGTFTGGTDITVADGGTGRSSHTAYAVLCGGTTTTAAQQSIAGVGTSGQVLTSNGAGALPTMQSIDFGAGNAALAYGAVGTYVMGFITTTSIAENTNYAGSSIEPAGIRSGSSGLLDDADGGADLTKGGSALSGTWRAMGRVSSESSLTRGRATLFLRIS